MEPWLRISFILSAYGFFRELRPSDPYVIVYFNQYYNLTSEQASKDVLPLGTYSILAQLVIIFLVTDMLRYKPIIVLSAFAGIIAYSIISWIHVILGIKIVQLFYGTILASEVAYYTYIYAKVEKERYQLVTGHTRAAILCGRFIAGMLGQLLLSTGTTTHLALLYISLGTQIVSLVIAIALPTVSKSLYFYADVEKIEDQTISEQHAKSIAHKNLGTHTASTKELTPTAAKPRFSWRNAAHLLLQHTVSAYSKPVVVQWSIWWALATCTQVQVVIYVQFLWKEIDAKQESVYNGAVEATVTLLGAFGAMAAGLMNSSRHKQWHWSIITICSLLMGAFLIVSAITNRIMVSYAMYILFGMVYFFVMTIASATVAENLSADSFGLIFGINALVALVLQTLLTVVVVTETGFGYGPRQQYIVYGGFYIVLACVYGIAMLIKFMFKYRHNGNFNLQ